MYSCISTLVSYVIMDVNIFECIFFNVMFWYVLLCFVMFCYVLFCCVYYVCCACVVMLCCALPLYVLICCAMYVGMLACWYGMLVWYGLRFHYRESDAIPGWSCHWGLLDDLLFYGKMIPDNGSIVQICRWNRLAISLYGLLDLSKGADNYDIMIIWSCSH